MFHWVLLFDAAVLPIKYVCEALAAGQLYRRYVLLFLCGLLLSSERVDFSCRRRLGLGMFRVLLDGGCDRIDDNSRERVLKAPICYTFYYTDSPLYVQIQPRAE